MGIIRDSLDAAAARTATRPIPKSAGAQMRFLVRQAGGTRAVAQLLGISQRTVERYVRDQIRRPRPELADRLAGEVRRRWQPRVAARARQQAATSTGIVVTTRARFGYSAPIGTSDDPRQRWITQALPPTYAARLFDAHRAGATEDQLQAVIAEGLRDMYFQDGGRRASGLHVEFTDVESAEIDY
ncbi:telomere-protecting terminal protein Tpg [Streptomyces sp. 8L]|uniref:telomere-protecting terminal protein Tpg n=1 Tax=Streptomyces sp. 8L TaxID=2877242 RepID=UPI001CD4E9D7|nr:helix-turn-helix domain-containing protein [Streptomyces sp. 8L]MCA1222186.1 XRE family transcriptional regulator [Streptomyces sp. 8L]